MNIPEDEGTFCLAFENKPYAVQEKGQVTAYLKYLRERYQRRFLLVYLPPSGEGPSCEDLPPSDRELWKKHFEVIPYAGKNSLADWFAACRKCCDAERVKAFLRDAERFCKKVSGNAAMMTDRTTQTAKQYLLDNPRHLPAALAVYDAWPLLRDEVCKRFLERLRDEVECQIRKLVEFADCNVHWRYEGKKPYSISLSIFREAWTQYNWNNPNHPERRTTVRLQAGANLGRGGPNEWIWGVWNPKPVSRMTESEKKRRGRLFLELRNGGLQFQHDDDYAVQYQPLDRYENWYPLVPDPREECGRSGGPITTHFVDGLLDIAAKAIPAIDAVEGQGQQ